MSKILVIEDTELIRENLADILEFSGYEVYTAENGKIGVELAIKHLPDVILSDILMPVMSGYEVLETLRSNPSTFFIPFIFLSAKADRENIRHGMALGADDYITKPYKNDDLLASIKVRLEKTKNIREKADEKISQIRNVLSTSLPHEMLTPLNGINGFSQLLLNDLKDLEKDEIELMVRNIHNSGKRLNHLIDNYILYNQLNVLGKNYENLTSVKKSFIPSFKIHEISNDLKSEYNREIDIQTYDDELVLETNDILFSKIIFEILDNALKFSKKGIIQLKAYAKEDNFHITIRDEGRGMTEEQINSIEAFTQFDRDDYEQQGMGLGLCIVKTIINLIDGEFNIQSELEEFTEVNIGIPIISFS